MANEKKDKKTTQLEINTPPLTRTKKKKGKKLIFFFIMLVIIGVVGFLFRKQISNYAGKTLKNVPVVNKLFKENTDPYSNITKSQLIKDLETNKTEAEQFNQTLLDLQGQNKALEEKINTLKQYETKYADFLSQKEAWDEKIAQTNPKMFLEQFEKMYPDTMGKIYKDIKIDAILTKEQKEFCNTVGQMEQEQAAKALETLISTDPDLIKLIFEGMEQERKSLILSSMQSENAATVIKLLSPNVAASNQ